jgi:hypothetical protein
MGCQNEITWLDFVVSVNQMQQCFQRSHEKAAQRYTGKGMAADQKPKVVESFRFVEKLIMLES